MSSRTPLGAKTAIVAGVVLLFAATGLLSAVFSPIRAGILAMAAPLSAWGSAFNVDVARQKKDLATTVLENESLRAENARLKQFRSENEDLKAALQFREADKEDLVTARVVARTTDDIFHGLIVDRGEDDGVRAGQPVIAGDGVIIGKVYAVRARTASVLLLTDTKSRLAVTVHDEAGTTGVLEGERGLGIRVSLIPATAKIAPGDPVSTSGLEPGVRRGLLVGTVDQVLKNAQDPFQSAIIVPFGTSVNPSYVQIVRDASPDIR